MPDPVTIDTIRGQYPQYNDMSDEQLAQGLHQKFYADMPFDKFAAKIGYSAEPNALTEYGPSAATPAATSPHQSQVGADINAAAQGLVGGTGAAVAGLGRGTLAAAAQGTKTQLAVMDAIDRGESVPADQDVIGYQSLSPDQRAKTREDFTAANDELAKREPNAAMRAGAAMQKFGADAFSVAPENESIQTGVGRMIGGAVPALVASAAGSAIGGPVGGVLAAAATVGSQTYDTTYQDAVSKGATPEEAENAAGKSAAVQALTMALPISQLARVPVPLREGLAKTLINLGQNGVEFGSANAVGTFAQNYVAQQTYDPGRSLTQGTGDAALEGMIAGLFIPAATTALHGGGSIEPVLKAPDIDTAIAAASQVAQTPAAPSPPDPASRYRQAPPMIPPNADAPVLPRIMDLLNEDDRVAASRPDFVPPGTPQPPIPMGWGDLFAQKPANDATAPDTRSVGAAASREQTPQDAIDLTTAQMKANRYQAEMGELLSPPQPNDKTVYVKNSLPTLAEYSGDPTISQQENLLRQRNPTAFVGEGKRLTENNNARVAAFEDITPSRTALSMMRDERNTQWNADSNDILPNAKPADLTPAADWADAQLSDPRIQENDAVRGVLEDFRDRLADEDGNLKTDPAAVWGIHDNIQNQLAKAKDPLNATASEKYAVSELMEAKKIIDGVMNQSTNGQFQTALDNYARASQAINAGEELEAFRPKLTNSSGAIMGERFHNFVVGLAKLRGDPGIDPAMSISDEAMRSLINIDNDMKRAGLIKLGSAAGSPTNLLGALAETMGLGTAHAIVGAHTFGIGNALLNNATKAVSGKLAQYRLEKLTEKHLAPPEGGYVYPHADDPGQPAAP